MEAALTLKLHADLHEWNLMTFVDPLPDLDLPRQSSFVRKETLSLLILDYLGTYHNVPHVITSAFDTQYNILGHRQGRCMGERR